MSGSDDDEPVGYGRPPKKHRFKKGQSGNPEGGWPQKRAKRERAKRRGEDSPQRMVVEWFKKRRRVRINRKTKDITLFELALLQLEEDALVKRDPQARKLFFDIAQRNGWFKVPPADRSGVLVVYKIPSKEDWIAETEGVRMSLDPLEGIPGAEGLMPNPKTSKRMFPPDEDEC